MREGNLKVKNIEEFRKLSEQLQKEGYTMTVPHKFNAASMSMESIGRMSVKAACAGGLENAVARERIGGLYASSGNEQMEESVGTPGLGWMEWGAGNKLPNLISLLSNMLPYTAAGWKFNTDTAAGLGPAPLYAYSRYVNGTVSTKEIPYAAAGNLIQGEIISLKKELQQGQGMELQKSIRERIDFLQQEYDIWKTTNEEVNTLLRNNNLDLTFLQLMGDQQLMGVCFPEILLSQNGSDSDSKTWKPKATGIAYRPAHICRMERMDKNNKINYVYISNRWYDQPVVGTQEYNAIGAIPALDPQQPVTSLEEYIRKARLANVPVNERPTRFILPSHYPTPGRPYYPQMPWHSIFGGDLYEYAYTIISDRLTRKKNSNIIGRVIYIHSDYLAQLYTQYECNTNAKKDELRDKIWTSIADWLSDRNNSGQSLLAFTFTGADGKEHKSFEIVEIESSNKNTATANEKEMSEISSVILFAMEINPELVGAIPGYQGSSGGTYLREMYLLKQLKMVPTQNIVIKVLDVISKFNNWDAHLKWKVRQQVMTTLDNSKTGLVESDNM